MLSSKASSKTTLNNVNNASNSSLHKLQLNNEKPKTAGSTSSLSTRDNQIQQESSLVNQQLSGQASMAALENSIEASKPSTPENADNEQAVEHIEEQNNLEEDQEEPHQEPEEEIPENLYDLEVQIAREAKFEALAKEKRRLLTEQLLDKEKAPQEALENNKKEQILLDYVELFNRQYSQLYPMRRDLLLTPRNEYGTQKFVCTTLRPSQLPFKELYNYDGCATFVKNYLAYEPLTTAHELPKTIASPALVLKQQSGNCFEFAMLLASLLIGSGYDAYVVSGYAVSEITLLDQSSIDIKSLNLPPVYNVNTLSSLESVILAEQQGLSWNSVLSLTEQEKSLNLSGVTGDGKETQSQENSSKYKVKLGRQLKSIFLEKQEQKKTERLAKEAQNAADKDLAKNVSSANADSEEGIDDLSGMRVHAWVLILPGKREIAEPFFIEPTTGKLYDLECTKYLGIESLFNNANYWVNMQPCVDGLRNISYDLTNSMNWEYVLNTVSEAADNWQVQSRYLIPQPGARDTAVGAKAAAALATADGQGSKPQTSAVSKLEPLRQAEMVPSWVEPLSLTPEKFTSRCPMGRRSTNFKNARLEEFDLGHRSDGLVLRITYFSDDAVNFGGQIREFYEQRRDKLVQRIRSPDLDQIQELFAPGRSQALKRHIFQNNQTVEMLFYSTARADGLLRRTDNYRKTTLDYLERNDGLRYRSISYSSVKGLPTTDLFKRDLGKVYKMSEKFEYCGASLDADGLSNDSHVQKKIFLMSESKIRVVYSMLRDQLFPCWREFKKWNPTTEPNYMEAIADNSLVFNVNKGVLPQTKQDLYRQYLSLLKDEQSCLNAIKHFEKEAREILLTRQSEENSISLVLTAYDIIASNTQQKGDATNKNSDKAATDKSDSKKPFTKSEGVEATKAAESTLAEPGAAHADSSFTESAAAAAAFTKIDYLSPFMINVRDPNNLTMEEALSVKDQCLQSFKQHLIDRATIIQQQLTSLTSEYQARQLSYSKNSDSMTVEESEEYVQFCNNTLFKIQILEKRLAKHKEVATPEYIEMDSKLRRDPRLAILNRKPFN